MSQPDFDPTAEIVARPNEPLEARLKRMQMRSWRRGIKEMDLILGAILGGQSRADEHGGAGSLSISF